MLVTIWCHDQPKVGRFASEFPVVIIPLARFPVCFLPSVKLFMMQRSKHLVPFFWMTVIFDVAPIHEDFPPQTQAVVAVPKLTVAMSKNFDADSDLRNFEFKLILLNILIKMIPTCSR